MGKFLRYELKRSKFFLAFMAVAGLFFSLIINFLYRKNSNLEFSMGLGFYLVLAVIFLVDLIYFVARFRKDIFSKSSYFTFTIDLSTGKIIFSKYLASFVISLLTMLVFVGSFKIFSRAFGITGDLLKSFNRVAFLSVLIYWLLSFAFLTIGVSLARVKIFNKYYEFVSLVLSVVLLVLLMWVMRNIYRLKPLMVDLTNFSIKNLSLINGVDFFMVYYDISQKPVGVNLWIFLLSLFFIAFGFFINLYLIEEKIDL